MHGARGNLTAMDLIDPYRPEVPPGQDELPYSDGEPMESYRHVLQMQLLMETLSDAWDAREDFFVGGNLATGLYGEGWMVRLGPLESQRVVQAGEGAQFEPMTGRPMKGYVLLPAPTIWDDGAIAGWVERALAYAGALPPKA